MKNRLMVGLTGCVIACVALAKEPPKVEYLDSGKVYPAGVPLSEAVRVDDTIYLSGQIGVQPGTLKLAPGGIREEARQAMSNIRTSLEAHGLTMADVVKCTVMLADISKWGEFNEVYKSFFTGHFPARSALGVNGLALGAQVEVDCIAVASKK